MDHPPDWPSIAFDELIEADHNLLTKLALQTSDTSMSPTKFRQCITELFWRLIRHDVSEEIVMRPVFAKYLGQEGSVMADHDRVEHKHLKEQLLILHDRIQSHSNPQDICIYQQEVILQLKPLMAEMKHHMDVESGQHLSMLMQKLGHQERYTIGRDYATTLILTPYHLPSYCTAVGSKEGRPTVIQIANYMKTNVEVFRQALSEMTDQRRLKNTVQTICNELETLGFHPDRLYDVRNLSNPKVRL